ncbi:MAG: translocation protein TolB [Planctomycetes bacterium ADurb.Bin126]|nr:MAG: translocation protein TolB [Planctomycetes bacterium ADurb.Bin126]HOD81618.1 hypothetical protein [Phycisphaerae bacterium]HQL71940.1 hypothetical protein [Phycisphaerae bacterium]
MHHRFCLAVSTGLLLACASAWAATENLAPKAKITADSQHSAQYRPALAADGVVPDPGAQDDAGKAWVVNGKTHRDGARITFEWPQPVTVQTVVYFGRTGWVWEENFKSCEVYVDGAAAPAVKAALKIGHGAQPIHLPAPVKLRKLELKFVGSYGGPNPGASEIRIHPTKPTDKELGKFIPPFDGDNAVLPEIEESPLLRQRAKDGSMGFDKLLLVQRHHIKCSHVYTYHCEGQRNGGGLFVLDLRTGRLRKLVDSADGQISSCDLSYDGNEILFSWRKETCYQVYRINVDGSGLVQLTDGEAHNYDACWLPDGDVCFLSTREPLAAYCFFTPVGILFRMRPDGSQQRCISANYLNDFTPAITNDGRIIYGRWEYVDRPAIPIQSLWTINPDGTNLAGFYGNRVLDPASFIEPQAIPGTDKILCTLTGHNGSCRGAIGVIDPVLGDNAQASIRNVTPDVRLRGIEHSSNGPRGPYQTPYPIDDRYFLVSYDGRILLRDYGCTEQAVIIEPQDGMGFYNPRPVRPRLRPPVRASVLPPKAPETDTAVLYLQDVYRGLGPTVKRGEIKRLAVVQEIERGLIDSKGIRRPAFDFQRVVVSCGATYVPKKVYGFVDVAEDGSAVFEVPARRPIYFLALDEQGRAVQRMRSFTHLMPGETQGCIGCHEKRTDVSHSRVPADSIGRTPAKIQPPEWGVKGFNYLEIVQPVLDKHCTRCHSADKAPKGVDLSGDLTDYFCVSYETLARGHRVLRVVYPGNEVSVDNPYTKWISTYNGQEWNILKIEPRTWGSPASKLAEIILADHPDAEGKPKVKLSADEKQRVLTWIDLNVPYYGTAQTAWPEMPGCRRQYPEKLDATLAEVATRRCATCHAGAQAAAAPAKGKPNPKAKSKAKAESKAPTAPPIPCGRWLRITNPHLNPFLRAPLAKSAGGTEKCGQAVFANTDDPDYKAILATFDPVLKGLGERPRMDMPGATPASCVPKER